MLSLIKIESWPSCPLISLFALSVAVDCKAWDLQSPRKERWCSLGTRGGSHGRYCCDESCTFCTGVMCLGSCCGGNIEARGLCRDSLDTTCRIPDEKLSDLDDGSGAMSASRLKEALAVKFEELDVERLRREAAFLREELVVALAEARRPLSGAASLFLSKDTVINIGKRDRRGKRDRFVTVDDILFGYDVLYEQQYMYMAQRWRGMIMQQDPADAFAIQDFLWTERPDAMIEFGTSFGGSAVFFAEIMTSYNPAAHIITIDPNPKHEDGRVKASSSVFWGSTIRPIRGYPHHNATRAKVAAILQELKPSKIFLNEDSSHFFNDVFHNLVNYQHLVRPCGWILVQDTKISRLEGTPGPIAAQRAFVRKYPEFKVNRAYEYFLYTQHAQGWLQRVPKGEECPASSGPPAHTS
mmetsp:Transcript_52081/g.111485  ORF Transcript_52081/g.111485 Transcript_52081/m.111485 type:complete len:411 (-) Transcript_52081:76-1308(-)